MHLSRRRNVLFFAEKTLRPGDGERWPVPVRGASRVRLKLLLSGTGFFHGKAV